MQGNVRRGRTLLCTKRKEGPQGDPYLCAITFRIAITLHGIQLGPPADIQAAIAGRGRSPLNHRRPQPTQTNCRIDMPLWGSTAVSSRSGPWHFQQRMTIRWDSVGSMLPWCTPNARGSRRVKSTVNGAMGRTALMAIVSGPVCRVRETGGRFSQVIMTIARSPALGESQAMHAAQLKRAWADEALYVRPDVVK